MKNDLGSPSLLELFVSFASGIISPTPSSAPAKRPWTERIAAYSTAATACLTAGIIILGVSQCTVSKGQLAVMQRQLNDAEIKDSASVVIRDLSLSGFPDHMTVGFDISNIGPTRAEMVTIFPTFGWGPSGGPLSVVTDPERNMLYEQPNEFGFTLAPEEKRHIDMPIRGIDYSHFPERARASLPTDAQLISGEFASDMLITAAYKTILD
jgi:hypothetical protein